MDKTRYLSYVAWDKLCDPFDHGGLGFRDLAPMNDALLMKLLWRVSSGADALWVGQVIAKYLPQSSLWDNKRTYRCMAFWRGLMNLREDLSSMVDWKVGDGLTCMVFARA